MEAYLMGKLTDLAEKDVNTPKITVGQKPITD